MIDYNDFVSTHQSTGLLATNPCRVRGAGQARRVSRTESATLEELTALVAALPERYGLMAVCASWCAMRFGELIELRRSDLDLKRGICMSIGPRSGSRAGS
jgi:integrase